ncbi:ECF RNA polymerase sigma factor SigJ [compost metagenome]
MLVEKFVAALSSGDMSKLMTVLSLDATLYSDGGGKVTAARRPILGAERIAAFFEGLLRKLEPGFSYKLAFVGGEPGLVTYSNGVTVSVFSFQIEQGKITAVYIVVNPDKLTLVH